ncbi:hypothetical protein H0H92_008566 [Tricholoma furcatifolium]|nr:hypothetical protein H0H92_008566 [Tricholoma furcatifolium]
MTSVKETLVISGLEIHVYSTAPTIISERKEVVVLFLLHGRYGSSNDTDPIARTLIEQTDKRENKACDLLVVTFVGSIDYISTTDVHGSCFALKDQRNHGKRLVERTGNNAWESDKSSPKHNARHASDMYAIQTGTARDVSLLIDFLPSFLYQDDKPHPIVDWGVAGISLGGHSTWITLASDERVTFGIPIIGCPDYNKLLAYRARQNGVDLSGKYYPKALKDTVAKLDPASSIRGSVNPFLGKRILVLSGAADTLVPWEASREFIEQKLDVGSNGVKKVCLYEGVGHECTKTMVQDMADFLSDNCLPKASRAQVSCTESVAGVIALMLQVAMKEANPLCQNKSEMGLRRNGEKNQWRPR